MHLSSSYRHVDQAGPAAGSLDLQAESASTYSHIILQVVFVEAVRLTPVLVLVLIVVGGAGLAGWCWALQGAMIIPNQSWQL